MSALSSFVSCPNIQTGLIETFNFDNLRPDQTNIVQFLLSNTNRIDTLQREINFREGGRKSVEVVYGQRFLESVVADGGRIDCTVGSVDGETSKIYSIDPTSGANMSVKINMADLETRCEADPLYVAREVRKMMNVILQKAETDAAIYLIANTGNFASDVDNGSPAGTTVFKQTQTVLSNGQIAYNGYEDVTFEMMNNDFLQTPVVFGGELWYKYAQAIKAACCGLTGVDAGLYASGNPYLFAYARKIAQNSANAANGVALAPGAVQMISFNEFKGEYRMIDDNALKQGTLMYPDANVPVEFDYYAQLICEGTERYWKLSLALNYDYVGLPTDMYQVGDRLEGVNGILTFRIVNPS